MIGFSSSDVDTLKGMGFRVAGGSYNLFDSSKNIVTHMSLSYNPDDDSPFYVKIKKTETGYSFTKGIITKVDGKIVFGYCKIVKGFCKSFSSLLKKIS